jgi:L-rhamnose mutarotase
MPHDASPATGMRKVCFLLHVKPELLDEYRQTHAAVWPEMLEELQRSGRHNYSLFLGEDGLLVGYFETDSPDDGEAYLAASEIAERWEHEMTKYFFDNGARPDQSIERLVQIFDLEGQLAAAGR